MKKIRGDYVDNSLKNQANIHLIGTSEMFWTLKPTCAPTKLVHWRHPDVNNVNSKSETVLQLWSWLATMLISSYFWEVLFPSSYWNSFLIWEGKWDSCSCIQCYIRQRIAALKWVQFLSHEFEAAAWIQQSVGQIKAETTVILVNKNVQLLEILPCKMWMQG